MEIMLETLSPSGNWTRAKFEIFKLQVEEAILIINYESECVPGVYRKRDIECIVNRMWMIMLAGDIYLFIVTTADAVVHQDHIQHSRRSRGMRTERKGRKSEMKYDIEHCVHSTRDEDSERNVKMWNSWTEKCKNNLLIKRILID